MICTVDATGFCERHKRRHAGDELEWALSDTPIGEGFRMEWDRQLGREVPAKSSEPKALCRHMYDSPVNRDGCGSCIAKWEYPCEIHGTCTPEGWRAGVKRCDGCDFYVPRGSDQIEYEPRYIELVNNLCPGDVLVMSAAIESLHRTYPRDFVTAFSGTAPELFEFNPHVVRKCEQIDGRRVQWEQVQMRYPLIDECDARPVHFMQGYSDYLGEQLGVRLPLVVNRPYVYLSPEESSWIPQVHEATESRESYWLVNAGYKDDYPAKWWGHSNYQTLVNILRGRVRFVQIGEAGHNHAPLDGAIDMRGKTDVRQLVRMVYHAAGGVGPSTFLQHLCAALQKPYVCVAGGREPLAWQHYPRQATLSTVGGGRCSKSLAGLSCWADAADKRTSKPGQTLCELPVINPAGECVSDCLDSINPRRVASEILARYNQRNTFA